MPERRQQLKFLLNTVNPRRSNVKRKYGGKITRQLIDGHVLFLRLLTKRDKIALAILYSDTQVLKKKRKKKTAASNIRAKTVRENTETIFYQHQIVAYLQYKLTEATESSYLFGVRDKATDSASGKGQLLKCPFDEARSEPPPKNRRKSQTTKLETILSSRQRRGGQVEER